MNPEVQMNLEEAVNEVLVTLTGMDLDYTSDSDRFRTITHMLNRALRGNALEQEWGYYSSTTSLGTVQEGDTEYYIPSNLRPRIINDDAVRLVDEHEHAVVWAYFLPRDALHKYAMKRKLWCSITKQQLLLSRPITADEAGLDLQIPTMREPTMFKLPAFGEEVAPGILAQLIDFNYPDLVILRAAYYYAQVDPVLQPRAQQLQEDYKSLMYQVMERDASFTDTPYQNAFRLPIENGVLSVDTEHWHPHTDVI